jgi:acetoacetate decarboxylase
MECVIDRCEDIANILEGVCLKYAWTHEARINSTTHAIATVVSTHALSP